MRLYFSLLVGMLALLLVKPEPLAAQEPHLTQFFNNPLFVNPALAGSTLKGRFIFNFRSQWPKLEGEFVTYQATYDAGSERTRSAFGIGVQLDQAGSAGIESLRMVANYAYGIPLQDWSLRFGLQFAYGSRSLDFINLVFGDQLSSVGLRNASTGETLANTLTSNYWEANTGLVLYNESFWLGVSGYNLNQPEVLLGSETERIDPRITVHTGYKYVWYRPGKKANEDYYMAFIPGAYYHIQGDIQQLDIGANFSVLPMSFGLWYRGVPIEESNSGALSGLVGIQYRGFAFQYNYDLPLGSFSRITGGGHEFSIVITPDDDPKKRRRRKRRRGYMTPFPDLSF